MGCPSGLRRPKPAIRTSRPLTTHAFKVTADPRFKPSNNANGFEVKRTSKRTTSPLTMARPSLRVGRSTSHCLETRDRRGQGAARNSCGLHLLRKFSQETPSDLQSGLHPLGERRIRPKGDEFGGWCIRPRPSGHRPLRKFLSAVEARLKIAPPVWSRSVASEEIFEDPIGTCCPDCGWKENPSEGPRCPVPAARLGTRGFQFMPKANG